MDIPLQGHKVGGLSEVAPWQFRTSSSNVQHATFREPDDNPIFDGVTQRGRRVLAGSRHHGVAALDPVRISTSSRADVRPEWLDVRKGAGPPAPRHAEVNRMRKIVCGMACSATGWLRSRRKSQLLVGDEELYQCGRASGGAHASPGHLRYGGRRLRIKRLDENA